MDKAKSHRLDVLLEAHLPDNIKRAADIKPEIIGINNRSLFTFEENLEHSVKYAHLLPKESIRLSLSSFKDRKDAELIAQAGFNGILIGTALMKSSNITESLKSFRDVPISAF